MYIWLKKQEKPENKQNKTVMIVSQVPSEFIRNMNETEDSNKNRNKICKTMKQHQNMLYMLKIYCKKRKQRKKSEFQKLTQNRPVYDELSPNLEHKVNDVQLS
jgi:hypothetical protein